MRLFSWLTLPAIFLATIYLFDRAWKAAAIWRFFQKPTPPPPSSWPSLSLIQPVTLSPNNLSQVFSLRARNPYPGPIEQVIVFDEGDSISKVICAEIMAKYPAWQPKIVVVPSANGIAMKAVKQLAGLKFASGEVLCFIDDDILLRPTTLELLVCHLQEGVGSVFGLACYSNWQNLWGGLMSAFVNANALLNYIPITYLSHPYTITGHIYAFRRVDFERIGGLNGMENRLDDDHELARRVMRAGLRNCQTPAVYDVDNQLTAVAFFDQLKRWFVFPRDCMLPGISSRAVLLTYINTLPNLLPGLVMLMALVNNSAILLLAACVIVFYLIFFWSERRYLKTRAPIWGWPLLLWAALFLPLQAVLLLFSNSTIHWRGQQILVKPGGTYEIKP